MQKTEIRNGNGRLLGIFNPEINAIEIANKDYLTIIYFRPEGSIKVYNTRR